MYTFPNVLFLTVFPINIRNTKHLSFLPGNKPSLRMGPGRQAKPQQAWSLWPTVGWGTGAAQTPTLQVTMYFRVPAWRPTERSGLLGQGSGGK